MKFGYAQGYMDGQVAANKVSERTICVLTEQIADLRLQVKHASDRADRAVDHLVTRVGLNAISESAKQEQRDRAKAVTDIVKAQPFDPFRELPLGHPEGSYANASEAALRYDDDAPVGV